MTESPAGTAIFVPTLKFTFEASASVENGKAAPSVALDSIRSLVDGPPGLCVWRRMLVGAHELEGAACEKHARSCPTATARRRGARP